MKLISIYSSKKTMALGLFMMMAIFTYGRSTSPADTRRVFWNKFDVIANNDNTVVLTWNVTEYNNKSFVVQHSVNGTDWEDIALVSSQNSPESMTDYSYRHSNKLSGKQFYRLRDIDVDLGSTGFSPVKTLILQKEKLPATIWPNPVTSHILVSNDKVNLYIKAKIFDLMGKIMLERKLDSDVTSIPVNELPAGTYIVRIENKKGIAYTQKIMKQ